MAETLWYIVETKTMKIVTEPLKSQEEVMDIMLKLRGGYQEYFIVRT